MCAFRQPRPRRFIPTGFRAYSASRRRAARGGDRARPLRDAARRPAAAWTSIYHLAAAVGVGQSMYEIAHYMEIEHPGHGEPTAGAAGSKAGSSEVCPMASSMSIYGEGQYRCAEHGMAAPPPRRRRNSRLDNGRCTARSAGPPRAGRHPESKPLQCSSIYALGQEGPGGMTACSSGRTLLACRWWPCVSSISTAPGQVAIESIHRSGGDFASRLLNRDTPHSSSKTASSSVTSSACMTWCGRTCWPWSAARQTAWRSTSVRAKR